MNFAGFCRKKRRKTIGKTSGEMGRWGDGEMGRWGIFHFSFFIFVILHLSLKKFSNDKCKVTAQPRQGYQKARALNIPNGRRLYTMI
jgi:hypothetical protein